MVEKKKLKPKRAKIEWEEPPVISQEEADRNMERFFVDLEEDLKGVPEVVIKSGAERFKSFLRGELSWAEIFNMPPEMTKQMIEYGYLQFQNARYEDAERFFKVLTILDWNNSYYHSMMGSILQRQKRYGEAIAEYSVAIGLNPSDIVSYTNRGDIFFQHNKLDEAEADLIKAVQLDETKEDKWANHAKVLLLKIKVIRDRKAKPKTDAAASKTNKKGKK
jgi:Flp pilus assembly protein TadD